MARKLGYETQGIIFNVYGAGLNSSAIYKRKDDIIVSLAGPIVNLLLIVLIVCFWWVLPSSYLFTLEFLKSNLAVMIFNLIPIYPLDGGRVVVALFGQKFKKEKILKVNKMLCLILGIVCCIGFVVSIFYYVNFSFIFIGVFLILNSIDVNKNLYFEKSSAFVKGDKELEVKIFKVNSLEKKKLLKYIRSDYYSMFLCEKHNKFILKSEEDILSLD
ncbi:MAG: hypothetical protein IJW59_02395 [Clostridia bacterium]|nr:hypothetical protein [Clostridia bacterium]